MTFPADIKGAMRDCLLKIFWAKDDIVSFFSNNGCTSSDVKNLGNYKEYSRAKIIDKLFNHIASKPDCGLGPFRAMLHSLVNWSHFDTFYFDKLKKLNRDDAKRAIEHLKQLQEIRDHKIKKDRKRREIKEQEAKSPQKSISELKKKHISLLQGELSTQQRGYELEKILLELFKISGLEVTKPFKVNGEQIDGAVKFDGEHYIVEAKWQDKASANEPVYQFAQKVEGKMYGRGIFVSINGFSDHVISSIVSGKAIRTIFIDGGDIMIVLENYLSFSEMLDKKIGSAQTKGLIYVDALSGKSKI